MEINIVKIGNSQGIRIPKAILKQVGLDKKARLVVENGTLIILPEDELTGRELAMMSEQALAKSWSTPEEDKAWVYLKHEL